MSTLQEICYNSLATTVSQAPPMIQEMVMGETRNRIKEEVSQEIRAEIREEIRAEIQEEQTRSTTSIFHLLVPDIVDDIIQSMTHQNRLRTNYHIVYAHLNPNIVQGAIETAEYTVRIMDDRYINNAFLVNNEHYNTHYNSDSDYEVEEDEY